jgi:ribosomal protein S18 acetylase RimI-like enzyme
MPQPSLTLRSFHWDDLPTLLAIKGASSTDDAERLRRWLSQPGMQPERDCFIALENDRPVAYCYLINEERIQRGVLLLEGAHVAIEHALVETAEHHARALGCTVMHVDVPESNSDRRQALAARGLHHVRTHWHMRRGDSALVPYAVPDGMRLRLAERSDALALTHLQNAAFTGTWGYSPNSDAEVEYRIFDLPLPDPDPVLLLEQEGGVLAYCWDHREGDGPGVVGMVGVHPSQQGRGLGRIVTAAGINYWVERGVLPVDITVDSENTPAVRLYESLGFELQWRSLWYERVLT